MNSYDNISYIPSIFDGAGAIEQIVGTDKVDELQDKVATNRTINGQISPQDIQTVLRGMRTKPILRDYKKIGRNDPCPCGSGKKYKNCCLNVGTYEERHQIGE